MYDSSGCSTSSPTFDIFSSFNFSCSGRLWLNVKMVIICIYPRSITNAVHLRSFCLFWFSAVLLKYGLLIGLFAFTFCFGCIVLLESISWCLSSALENTQPFFSVLLLSHFLFSLPLGLLHATTFHFIPFVFHSFSWIFIHLSVR